MLCRPHASMRSPYTTLFRSIKLGRELEGLDFPPYPGELGKRIFDNVSKLAWAGWINHQTMLVNEYRLNLSDIKARSEEHTSELQSPCNLVCRLLLEKKKTNQ